MIVRLLIRVVTVSAFAAIVGVAVVDVVQGLPSGGLHLIYAAAAAVFVAVGWLITERRAGNLVGPLLVLFGAAFAWYIPADIYLHLPADLPGSVFAALFISMLDAPMFILIALLLLQFPDGHVPSDRWRWTIWASLVGLVIAPLGYALDARPLPLYPEYASPFGIAGLNSQELVSVSYVIMLGLLVAAAASLIVRWRRGDVVTRAQIKWVATAAVVMTITEMINVATFDFANPNALTNIVATLGITTVPVAMGVAILRYRLYEIDRLISRTIGWAIVTGLLVGTFALGVIALQALLGGVTQGETLAVAASTLVAFALFQPLRRRVQRVVDRRFNRARYDAQRTATAFAGRLRHQLDLPMLTEELRCATAESVEPHAAAVWLRPRGTR